MHLHTLQPTLSSPNLTINMHLYIKQHARRSETRLQRRHTRRHDIHLHSLHSEHANLTINMLLYTLQCACRPEMRLQRQHTLPYLTLPYLTFTVRASPGDAFATTAHPPSPVSVSGLSNGVTYTFTVAAVNGDGAGPPSEPSELVIPNGFVPVAPVLLRAVPG
jgi:hypothetical protein